MMNTYPGESLGQTAGRWIDSLPTMEKRLRAFWQVHQMVIADEWPPGPDVAAPETAGPLRAHIPEAIPLDRLDDELLDIDATSEVAVRCLDLLRKGAELVTLMDEDQERDTVIDSLARQCHVWWFG